MLILTDIVGRALVSGSVASIVSTAVLATLTKAKGRGFAAATNATSHWLHGDSASRTDAIDVAHTGVGYVTRHASAVFWACLFEALRGDPRSPRMGTVPAAASTAAIAAVVDYGLVPKRVTPGWELELHWRDVALGFVGLAMGLAAGSAFTDKLFDRG